MRYVILTAALLAATVWAQAPKPLDKDQIIATIGTIKKQSDTDRATAEAVAVGIIRSRRLSFPASPETLQELRAAGASPEVLSAVTDSQLTAKDLFPAQSDASRITKEILLQVIAGVTRQKTPSERSYLEQGVIAYLRGRRTDFLVTPAVEQEMRSSGASAPLIAAVAEIQLTSAELLQTAQADLQAGRVRQAVSEAEAAASFRPSLQAFQLLATAKAQANDIEGSQAASLKAVSAGGEVTIPVLLAPTGENFRKTCDAKLTVAKGRVTLLPGSAGPECAASEIRAATLIAFGPNDYVGKDRQAYHVLVQSAKGSLVNLCLAPVSGGNKWALDVLATAATR